MQFMLNQRQREHIARDLQTLALGPFAYFEYRMITEGRTGWLLASFFTYAVIETVAVFYLKDIE